MSRKNGYVYDNVKEFCEKYGCKLLSTKEEIELKPKEFNIKSYCGHERTTTFNKLFKHKVGVYCDDCFENMIEARCFGCDSMFASTNTSFVYCSIKCSNTRIVSEEQKQKVRDTFCKKYGYYDEDGKLINDTEGLNKLRWKRCGKRRNESSTKRRRVMGIKEKKKYTYDMIKEIYENEGCELLITKEDFNKDKMCRIFKIRGKCGHMIERSNIYDFVCMGIHINCSTCTNENKLELARKNSKIDGIPTPMIIEKSGVDLLKEKCEDKYIIIKTREACAADVLVKPINEKNDLWLPIQLKVSAKKYKFPKIDRYSFGIGGKQYDNMLLMLICVEDSKFWLFNSNYEYIRNLQTITISDKSKYNKFEVTDLVNFFDNWYNSNSYNITFHQGNTPKNKSSQLEYEYVLLREDKIDFLTFIHNEYDGLVYDFKIGDLKIQEKVCTYYKHKNFHRAGLCKNGRGDDDITQKIPYFQGDNDFYWFNIQDKNTFYVVPEKELIDRNFISTEDGKGKTTISFGLINNWLNNYKFYYDTINEEDNKQRLLELIEE